MNTQQDDIYFEYDFNKLQNLYKFAHQAMATVFEIFIIHPDPVYARNAAQAAFAECDRLEQQLSRFIPNSDITRINSASAHSPVIVGLDALDCIAVAYEAWRHTRGAFDITITPLLDCYFDNQRQPRVPDAAEIWTARNLVGMDHLHIDWAARTLTKTDAAVGIDLGGIGKGYAIDKMQQVLRYWEISHAFIHGGQSSAIAFDASEDFSGWPVTFTHPASHATIAAAALRNKALSGSGIRKQNHIIDPISGKAVTENIAAWSCTSGAAYADALSTAFMVMSIEQIIGFCKALADVGAIVVTRGGISRFNEF